jgi:(p)ppGpp synthase/HD superfamily hydrolase
LPASLAVPVSQRFHDALSYASTLHASQARKGAEIPYVAHLLAVASIVMEAGGDENEAIAALLHDGPEDQGGKKTLQEIRQRFGDTVAHIVAECSDTFEDPKPEWKKRKRDYIERLGNADKSSLLVSAADKAHNARATVRDVRAHGAIVWKRFSATRQQTVENYRQLIGAYDRGAEDGRRTAVVRELSELIEQMAKL